MGFIGGFLKKVVSIAAPILSIASFVFPVLAPVAMAVNAAKGLLKKPPDWMGVISSVAGSGLSSAFSGALSSFTSGTSGAFAKIVGEKATDWLGQTAAKVTETIGDNFLSRGFQSVTDTLARKFNDETFQNFLASTINRATNTQADDILTRDQIAAQQGNILNTAYYDRVNGIGSTVDALVIQRTREGSQYNPAAQPPVIISDTPLRTGPELTGDPDYRPPRTYT